MSYNQLLADHWRNLSALLECDDPEEIITQILHGSGGTAERDTVDAALLEGAPDVHQKPMFPKVLIKHV